MVINTPTGRNEFSKGFTVPSIYARTRVDFTNFDQRLAEQVLFGDVVVG